MKAILNHKKNFQYQRNARGFAPFKSKKCSGIFQVSYNQGNFHVLGIDVHSAINSDKSLSKNFFPRFLKNGAVFNFK